MSDFDGVDLAAIQALGRRTASPDARVRSLESQNAALRDENQQLRTDAEALRAQNAAFEQRLRQIEQAVSAPRRRHRVFRGGNAGRGPCSPASHEFRR
jgi:hypothetical protein